jgi:hypothetical protein
MSEPNEASIERNIEVLLEHYGWAGLTHDNGPSNQAESTEAVHHCIHTPLNENKDALCDAYSGDVSQRGN